jgi:hypothetical protein
MYQRSTGNQKESQLDIDGQKAHTKSPAEFSENYLFHAHNIHFSTYYFKKLLFGSAIGHSVLTFKKESWQNFFLQESRSPSRQKVLLLGNEDL